jgi:hypothetical protein
MAKGALWGLFIAIAFTAAGYLLALASFPDPWQRFFNSYMSFYLPQGWECVPAGTEFVCRSNESDVARRSLFVMTAKFIGPDDNYSYYERYLREPRAPGVESDSSAPKSIVEAVEYRSISGQKWLVAVHRGSLLENYRTYYYVTLHKNLAVLITYSHHIDASRRVSSVGEQAAGSLVVFN